MGTLEELIGMTNGDDTEDPIVTFVVEDSTEMNNSVVHLSPVTMDDLNIWYAVAILLEGNNNRKAVCTVITDENCGENKIRMNAVVRNKFGVSLGDSVSLGSFLEIPKGRKIVVRPVRDGGQNCDFLQENLLESYLRPYFFGANRPVNNGDVFSVKGRARTIQFKVVKVLPLPFCIVGPSTIIHCEEHKVANKRSKKESARVSKKVKGPQIALQSSRRSPVQTTNAVPLQNDDALPVQNNSDTLPLPTVDKLLEPTIDKLRVTKTTKLPVRVTHRLPVQNVETSSEHQNENGRIEMVAVIKVEPPPQDQQSIDSINPANKLSKESLPKDSGLFTQTVGKPIKVEPDEQVVTKQLAIHELALEQQLYYNEITEACVGSDETKRTEALQSLSNNPGLHEMLPKLCKFISESVRVNVAQCDLARLIHLMRMVKGLLENQALPLEKYIYEIIPSVGNCITSKQLCLRPEVLNHWALRDFASRLMAKIYRTYTTSVNSIHTRMTRMLSHVLTHEKMFLSSVYGAIACIGELGPDVVKVFIIPKIKDIGTRIEFCIDGEGHTQADKTSASKIKTLIIKLVGHVLKMSRPPPDIQEKYKTEFGYLGQALYGDVSELRTQEQAQASTTTTAATFTNFTRPMN